MEHLLQITYPVIDSNCGNEVGVQEGTVFESYQNASFAGAAVAQQHNLNVKRTVVPHFIYIFLG